MYSVSSLAPSSISLLLHYYVLYVALVSVVVLMGCQSETGVYEAGRESSQHTHYNNLDDTTALTGF